MNLPEGIPNYKTGLGDYPPVSAAAIAQGAKAFLGVSEAQTRVEQPAFSVCVGHWPTGELHQQGKETAMGEWVQYIEIAANIATIVALAIALYEFL